MTDSPTTEVEPVVEPVAEGDSQSPKELREYAKRQSEQAAKYKGIALENSFAKIGLDPTKGLGKAIAKEYDGEPDAESLLEFAKTEYEYEPVAADHPNQQKIDAEQAKLDAVQVSSTSVTPDNETELLRKASADGDLKTAGAIKAAQLRRKFG